MKNPVINVTPTEEAVVNTANEAFVFGLPLVLMGLTKEQNTNYAEASSDGAPVNQFSHKSTFPDYEDTQVVRPNCDTYYSITFLDLTAEPMVMSLPTIEGIYYMMPFLDAYTNLIDGSPGTRTGEIAAKNYIIALPHQEVPEKYKQDSDFEIITSPTSLIWAVGRFQVDNEAVDGPVVANIQENSSLIPLSAWGTDYTPPQGTIQDVPEGSPNDIVMDMPIADFFARLNQLLAENPPMVACKTEEEAVTLEAALVKFGEIGVGPHATTPFGEMDFDEATQRAMSRIPRKVLTTLDIASNSSQEEWNGLISSSIADFGANYQERAMVAYVGLGANPNADAVYYKALVDSADKAFDGDQCYCITFEPHNHPPCNSGAFWSLTMYNADGYLTKNEPCAVGHSSDKPFYYEDGSSGTDNDNTDKTLKIFMQPNPPTDTNYTNNWLPTPAGETFNLMIRIYWPDENAQTLPADGGWQAPAVVLQDNPI